MIEVKEKTVRLDFSKPHITYYNDKEQKIVGVTTALNVLNKPALVGWAYNKGLAGENLYEKDESANAGTVTHARILGYFLGYEIDQYNISQEVWDWSENSSIYSLSNDGINRANDAPIQLRSRPIEIHTQTRAYRLCRNTPTINIIILS